MAIETKLPAVNLITLRVLDFSGFPGCGQRGKTALEARLHNHRSEIMKGLIILLSIGIISWAVLAIWVTWVACRSRGGYQDDRGFHFESGSDSLGETQERQSQILTEIVPTADPRTEGCGRVIS